MSAKFEPLKYENSDAGFATAWMIIFSLIIILIGALFFTFGTAIVQRQHLVEAADRAASIGADTIDEQELIDSDGAHIWLNTNSGHGDLAEVVCKDTIVNESTKPGSKIDTGDSTCNVVDHSTIKVVVVGDVSWGAFASIMGVSSTRFKAVSRATPTCSDLGC